MAIVAPDREELGLKVSLKSAAQLTPVPCGDHRSSSQRAQVARLQEEFSNVFSPLPGHTNLIQHFTEIPPGVVVHSSSYQLHEHKKMLFEINSRLCSTCSPVVLVPKADGSVHFCVDFRKVKVVSKFNTYPMPHIVELLDRLGVARFGLDTGLNQEILADSL